LDALLWCVRMGHRDVLIFSLACYDGVLIL
jgi:hypothetical protein